MVDHGHMDYCERQSQIEREVRDFAYRSDRVVGNVDGDVVEGTDDPSWVESNPEVARVVWRKRGQYTAPVVYTEGDFLTRVGFAVGWVSGVEDPVVMIEDRVPERAEQAVLIHEIESHGRWGDKVKVELLAKIDTVVRDPVGAVHVGVVLADVLSKEFARRAVVDVERVKRIAGRVFS
jgi:hypothetical protein